MTLIELIEGDLIRGRTVTLGHTGATIDSCNPVRPIPLGRESLTRLIALSAVLAELDDDGVEPAARSPCIGFEAPLAVLKGKGRRRRKTPDWIRQLMTASNLRPTITYQFKVWALGYQPAVCDLPDRSEYEEELAEAEASHDEEELCDLSTDLDDLLDAKLPEIEAALFGTRPPTPAA